MTRPGPTSRVHASDRDRRSSQRGRVAEPVSIQAAVPAHEHGGEADEAVQDGDQLIEIPEEVLTFYARRYAEQEGER